MNQIYYLAFKKIYIEGKSRKIEPLIAPASEVYPGIEAVLTQSLGNLFLWQLNRCQFTASSASL